MTRDHFLSTSSDDAALSMIGCEPHSENFGGTILLTRGSEGWNMLWYKAGVDTSKCHPVPVENPREILVCVGSFGGQGRVWTELFVEDLLAPVPSLMASGGTAFFSASDNLGAGLLDCGRNFDGARVPVVHGGIQKVDFGTGTNHGPLVSVTAFTGEKWLNKEETETCEDMRDAREARHKLDIFPVTKSYHLEFLFEGHDFKPTPGSAASAQLFR